MVVGTPMMADSAYLRRQLLTEIRGRGGATTDSVAGALLAVPRHVFVPEVAVEAAYRDEAIVTKRNAYGVPVSSSSQPTIMAFMLDQLDLAPGHRVLEIGAGTGYNAALLAHLVGPAGAVVSVEIDPEAAQRARASLTGAGYPQVTVICADGAQGHAAAAPYDRLIATVGVWDLAPAWLDQLAPGARIVVPLDVRGIQVSVALEREGDHWVSRSLVGCGFMRMRGELAGPERTHMLDQEARLGLVMPDARTVDVGGVRAALARAPTTHPTGVLFGATDMFSGVGLWLAVTEPRSCTLSDEDRGAVVLRQALVQAQGFRTTVGIIDAANIAVLGCRGIAQAPYELDAHGYGPDGDRLAADLASHVRAWDAAGRPSIERLRIIAYPSSAGDLDSVGTVIDKTHTRLVITATA
jgi:protein-L-isoaspartate(D-aspartate) O-methyltransferase